MRRSESQYLIVASSDSSPRGTVIAADVFASGVLMSE